MCMFTIQLAVENAGIENAGIENAGIITTVRCASDHTHLEHLWLLQSILKAGAPWLQAQLEHHRAVVRVQPITARDSIGHGVEWSQAQLLLIQVSRRGQAIRRGVSAINAHTASCDIQGALHFDMCHATLRVLPTTLTTTGMLYWIAITSAEQLTC